MKSSTSFPSRFFRSMPILWLLTALILFQALRLHQLEKRLDLLTTPTIEEDSESSEHVEASSVSEDLLSFLDAFGASEEVEMRENVNLEAAKSYFQATDWATQNLSLQNIEGVPVENGLSFELNAKDVDSAVVTLLLDHQGLFSLQSYRNELNIEDSKSFESVKLALESYLKSSDFTADLESAKAVQAAERNFSEQVLGDEAVFSALQAKGMKLDYSEEDLEEQRLVFTNIELTPVLIVGIQKRDAAMHVQVLAGSVSESPLDLPENDVSFFLNLLEQVDARPKLEQIVGDRRQELNILFSDDATRSVFDRYGFQLGEQTEDASFFIYPLLNVEGEIVVEILLERASGDVQVRFDGQILNLVEATQSLQTVKKNS